MMRRRASMSSETVRGRSRSSSRIPSRVGLPSTRNSRAEARSSSGTVVAVGGAVEIDMGDVEIDQRLHVPIAVRQQIFGAEAPVHVGDVVVGGVDVHAIAVQDVPRRLGPRVGPGRDLGVQRLREEGGAGAEPGGARRVRLANFLRHDDVVGESDGESVFRRLALCQTLRIPYPKASCFSPDSRKASAAETGNPGRQML